MLVLTGGIYPLLANLFLTPHVAAKSTNSSASNPGCYSYCKYIQTDFDPTRMNDLCNETTSLGDLFTKNIDYCADCVRNNSGLNDTYYDQGDAQDTLKVVNLCQANFPTNHSNIVSAMSVISQHGKVVGTIASAQATTSATAPPAGVPATATATSSSPPVNQASNSESKAWIAGAVIGPIAGVAIVLVGLFITSKRRQKKQSTVETPQNGGYVHEKSELPAQGRERVEIPTQHVVEAPIKLAPQELESTVVAELPDNSSAQRP